MLGKPDIYLQKKATGPLTPPTKTNFKCVNILNIRPEGIKSLEENTGKKFLAIGLGNDFSGVIPKTQATNAKINKWDDFCTAKETIKKVKR